MTQRLNNPAAHLQGALPSLLDLGTYAKTQSIPAGLIDLIYLRVSQINGCAYCCELHARELREAGESQRRIDLLPAFREAPDFSDAEKAALALAEAGTRLGDRAEPVSDDVWQAAARQFEDPELAVLLLNIALINFWNRLNAMSGQPPQKAKLRTADK